MAGARVTAMRLGVHLGFFPLRWPREPRVRLVGEAEALGYDSIWSAESTGGDAATQLAWVAALTERVELGVAVLQMPARSPAMTAMTAIALDRLSDGRLHLGLGASTKAVTEDWHGQDFGRQLQRTREYVQVVRQALDGGRLAIDGEILTLPGAGAKAMRSTDRPIQERIPLLLAAIGPRNLALCGEIADGWIATMSGPDQIREGRAMVAEGAAAAGHELAEDYPVLMHVMTAVDEDPAAARDAVRPMLSVYMGMGDAPRSLYRRLFDRLGFEADATVVHEHFQAGRFEDAQAAVPDALIDAITLCGTQDQVAGRLREYRAAGVTTLLAHFQAETPERWGANLHALKAAHDS